MRSYMAVPPQKAGQADLSIPAIAVGTQVDLLVLDRSPQPLHQDVVVAALPPRPADPDPLSLQPRHEVARGELAALIGVEDLGPAATFQRHLKGIQTEFRVKAVGELPAEHVPGEQIHDRHKVEEPLLQRDVGDVCGPHLVDCGDLFEIHQAGKALCWLSWNGGARFTVDRP